MVTVSAPGKLMLFGEHAVVYGYPCIMTAVSERMMVSVEKIDGATRIDAPGVNDTRFVDAAVKTAKSLFGLTSPTYHITTTSGFSGTVGFGSSSAVTVATLMAIATIENKHVEKRHIFDAAFQTIRDVQGLGSGFDVAAAIFGGTVYFQNAGEIIDSVSFEHDDVNVVVGFCGVKADTVEMVKQVAVKRETYPERVTRIFDSIGKIVEESRTAIANKEWETVGKLMNFNQEYLRDLGVSTEKLENLISAAKNAGAFGAKLSGAGGGDCMICLTSKEKKQAVEEAISEAGGQVMPVTINEEGVRVE